MQPQQYSRIDLAELKAQLVKRIGAERSKRYFYFLNKLLSQKLSKKEFDRLCCRELGSENVSLHNQFIRSILKNACQAKTPPPPVHANVPSKLGVQGVNIFPGREDGQEQPGAVFPNQNVPIWSNGVLPSSPKKGRTVGIRERKIKDRPSPLGPNGKVDHLSMVLEDGGGMENGDATPCDYQRPVHHLQPVAEMPEIERLSATIARPIEKPRIHSKASSGGGAVVDDGEEVEQANSLNFFRSPLIAPLGIPFCSASVGGSRKAAPPPVGSSGEVVSYYDSGGLSDTESLRKRMEQIASAQGLGGVSTECANTMNSMLDVYLKRLIRSCVELVGVRSAAHEPRKQNAQKQQVQGKVTNGMWPSNHMHMNMNMHGGNTSVEATQQNSISLLDFKVAMELNPQQLGDDWPLLLEKISIHSFEE